MAQSTIVQAVSERQVKDANALLPTINKELIPVLRELRNAANRETTQTFTVSTAALAAFTNIWTSDAMPTNTTWTVRAKIKARTTAGATQQVSYERVGLFTNEAGSVSQIGTTQTIYTIESAAACDVRMLVSGQTVTVDVKDDGVSTFAWIAIISIFATPEI